VRFVSRCFPPPSLPPQPANGAPVVAGSGGVIASIRAHHPQVCVSVCLCVCVSVCVCEYVRARVSMLLSCLLPLKTRAL